MTVIVVSIVVIFTPSSIEHGTPPRFVPLQLAPTFTNSYEMYDWGGIAPFHNGKGWVWVRNGNKAHQYLYDLNKPMIVGELLHGGAVGFNEDGTQLLCGQATEGGSLRDKFINELIAIVAKFRHKPPPKAAYRYESVWALNLKRNSATHVGTLQQYSGAGSSWKPSPSGRFAYNQTSMQFVAHKFWLFDFHTEKMREVNSSIDPDGWWDDEHILISDPDQITLYNVLTDETTDLFTKADIAMFMVTNGLATVGGGIIPPRILREWNGKQCDFYLAPSQPYSTNKTFLAVIDRNGPTLKLITKEFAHRWTGHFSGDGKYYLFSNETGRWGQGGDGSVWLRDLSTGSEKALVPSDKSNQYSLCRFYDGGVIYVRNRRLWRIDLNGSNNVPLFGHGN